MNFRTEPDNSCPSGNAVTQSASYKPRCTERQSPVVVIPAYKPSPCLPDIVRHILLSGIIHDVVVVNDGSGPDQDALFDDLAAIEGVRVLSHMVNLGKGAALKTALNYVGCAFPTTVGVVTADADGQHLVPDVIQVAEALLQTRRALVLGTRQMADGIPLRSRFGNIVTRYVMNAVTGQNLVDTQTGLRGIPIQLFPALLRAKTTGYDFELDMLVICKYTNQRVQQVQISTVYLDGNKSSHFNPVLDSMRIYFVLLRFTFVSFMTAGLDNLVFIGALRVIPDVLAAQIIGRACAGTFNYYVNKKGVFQSHARNIEALPKYWLFVTIFGALSYILIQLILAYTGLTVVAAKLLAEAVIFFFSFVVQRDFVFAERPASERIVSS